MSMIVRKKVDWAKYLRMIGSLKCDIALVAYENGDFSRSEVVDELNSFYRSCTEIEASFWRLYKLMNTECGSNDKEVE